MAPHSFGFRHVGTEIHWYSCKNYIVYPKYKDDTPNTNLLAMDDHSQYRCISSMSDSEIEEAAVACNDTEAKNEDIFV